MSGLAWRLERQNRAAGTYFVLATGRGADRRSISVGFVAADVAKRALDGLHRVVHRDGAALDLTVERGADGVLRPVDREVLLRRLLELADRKVDPEVYKDVSPGAMTLASYVAMHWAAERSRSNPSSWEREERLWRLYLLPEFGRTLLKNLGAVCFDAFINGLKGIRGGPLSGNSLRLVRAAYQACLTYAERRGHIASVHRFYPLKGSTRRALAPPEPLSQLEVEALIVNGGSEMHRVLFAFAFDQGPRPAEAVALDWEDVSFDVTPRSPFGTVRIRGTKTARADRVVPLFAMARRYLYAWWKKQGRPLSGRVFLYKGRPYESGCTFRVALRGAAERAGIRPRRIFPYLTRHTMVTAARAAGASREEVAAVAGHTSPRMIDEVYDHSSVAQRVDVSRFPRR